MRILHRPGGCAQRSKTNAFAHGPRIFACAILVLMPALNAQAPADKPEAEQRHLDQVLSEVGTSPLEFIRALEKHLAKFPNTQRRPEMERALVKAAIEAKDSTRIVKYGEQVIARGPADDLQLLDNLALALLSTSEAPAAERALKYARRAEELIRGMQAQKPPSRMGAATWREDMDRGIGRALVMQARANGILGKYPEAIDLSTKSFNAYPTAEAARELAKWLSRANRTDEAIQAYADAFTIADPRNRDSDRAFARAAMGELHRKSKGSEAGLGDIVLQAYDRTTALLAERKLRLRSLDPNSQATSPMEFTLSKLGGGKLALSSLRGKVIVMDFWATWCGPCRAQHPLYAEVKKKFADKPEVVFLSINTDEERDSVPGFIAEHKWENSVYFEDGLSMNLKISSIPTTILIGKQGEVVSRLNGFIPERFVSMLTDRIQEALNR